MKKLWKKVRRGSPSRTGDASPKSGSLRGSVASLNTEYEVKEKDLGKLHKAAWIGDLNKVRQLARKDTSPLDKENRTPLHLACVRGNEQVVQTLMEWRAKANVGDNQNRTPLMRAVEFQQEGCVRVLLDYGVDLDTQDYMGNMPIHLAVQCGNPLILAHLIAAGASLNIRNKEGFAPLHLAVRNKMEDICHVLLKERANVNVEDTNLRTPLMYACQDGSISLVKLLLHYNADTVHKDSKGWSADDCAVIQGHHACSQLISDYNVKMSRTTPASTPRSSLPPSVVNTPRDKDSIGMPVQDGGGDDSDNETISRASGGPGSDSWADSPEVSVVDDKKAKEEGTDAEDEIFDENKPGQKISLAKFAKNIHISESDTDGDSMHGSIKRQNQKGSENGGGTRAAANTRQTSWQSQTSGEDNSWGDSPVTPRKNSAQRVSFKRDEELSEIHDITVTESEAESDVHDPAAAKDKKDSKNDAAGYSPTDTNTNNGAAMSAEKMKAKTKDPALMEELGISDVDDISEMSDQGEDSAPAVPSTLPPAAAGKSDKADSDWDASAISDIMATPRPGILKKWSNAGLNDSQDDKKEPQKEKKEEDKPKHLIKATVIVDSDDESSAWDTTEADNMIPEHRKQPLVQKKSSTLEWDSDLEEMVNPVSPATSSAPTLPAVPFTSRTIPKEVEAIVRQKQAECQDSDEETMSPSPVLTQNVTQSAKFYVGSSSSNESSKEDEENNVGIQHNNDEDEEDEDDNWDSTGDAVTPRGNAGLQYKEVNIGEPPSVSETAIVPDKVTKAQTQPVSNFLSSVMNSADKDDDDEEEEEESAWDSEDDALPSDQVSPAKPVASLNPTTSTPLKTVDDEPKKLQEKVIDSDQSEEETETVSSWELERREKKALNKSAEETLSARQQELEEEQKRKEQEGKGKQLAEDQRQRERLKLEEEEKRKREQEEMERKEREEEERNRQEKEIKEQEAKQREEEERREWEIEEAKRQEQLRLEWEREEKEQQEKLKEAAEEMIKMETQTEEFTPPDTVRRQQQELNRIDEQFQREREKREHEEKRREEQVKQEEEAKMRLAEETQIKQETIVSLNSPPPLPASHLKESPLKPAAVSPSSGSGVYVNIGSSTVEQIRQRLQVPSASPAAATSPTLMSTGQFNPMGSDRFDDTDSLFSENPGDDRPYMSGQLYKADHLLEDDALSYTSTEFEEPVQSSAAYARDRDVLTNINLSDPSSLLKVQEHVRDSRRQLEQERNQRMVLENKLKLSAKEKSELAKKVESITLQKSSLEQSQIDLEAKIRSLEYTMSDEEEKRKNAEVLLNKTKEQLSRKETQYSSELEARQRAELNLRKVQIEMQTSTNTIKELQEEKEELQRQLTHAHDARALQEQINEDQHKFFSQQQQQLQQTSQSQDAENLESSAEMDKLKAELYAFKMDKERERSRFKDELALMGTDNEELMNKVEELRNDIKLNEEALAHATMQYNIQVSSLRTDISSANATMEREKSTKEKLESEVESLKTRLMAATNEMDKTIRTRNEMEREYRRNKELWTRDMDRQDTELAMVKENSQHLNQRLQSTEAKLNSIESELHVSNTSLMERTAQLQQLKQDFDRHQTGHETLDQNLRLEKEHSAKLQAKMENMQEKLTQHQHENLSLRQQLDSLKLSSGGLPGSDANEKLNNILTNLRADSDRAKASLEERNSSLIEQVARLKEEVRGAEARRTSQEQDLRRLHGEHSEMVKKLSHSEASLQIAMRSKEQLEQETARLKAEMEKLQHRYQSTHDKSVEAQARLSEIVDRLEKAENSSLLSTQQLANTSANMQAVAKSKSDLDESMQHLHIENAKLEAELKYEKQRADMLYQDLQDSQKVRSSLEALCANLKSTSAHLEEKLGEETAARVVYEADAKDHKVLLDHEMKSRSRLGLRIADLEKHRQDNETKIGMEKNRSNQANEERRSLGSLLEAEREKNQLLQKDNNTLKLHLKSAKNKMKSPRYAEFQREVDNAENINVSTPRNQPRYYENDRSHPLLTDMLALRQSVHKMDHSRRKMESEIRFLESQMIGDGNQDVRAELEAKYRMELNRKLEDVNRFLDSQSQLRDKLDTSRTEVEVHLLSDKRKLEEEISNLRIKYEQVVAQREMKDLEVKRFRELYESEMKWRMRVSDQLQMTMDKGSVLKSKLNNERLHRNRLAGSIGNLNSTLLSNASFDIGKVNGFHDDELSNKIKAELDRSIAKHLEAAPHDLNTPILRPTKEPTRFSSSLTQASHDYIDVLKRKYCV